MKCFYCDRVFERNADLDRHMRVPCRLSPDVARVVHRDRGVNQTMAKKQTAKTPARSGGRRQQNNPPFIEAANLPRDGKPAAFTISEYASIYHRDDGSTSIFLRVENRSGEEFTWSLRCGSPDRIELQQTLGRNMFDWARKTIRLHAVEGSRGGEFVNLYRDRE
jgi:uncharacterized C2H2 Zn-finger protein